MVSISGNIALNNVSDKDMELIWGYKAKHGDAFGFLPNTIQIQHLPNRSVIYNNVQFTYGGLHGLNLITEVVNELHKREPEVKAAGQ
ncbi:MAG TPA: hypothetical protein VKB38_04570 [Terracidiphilus sp.]|nr:hypothetical protein [Terracidiphilus sp.]